MTKRLQPWFNTFHACRVPKSEKQNTWQPKLSKSNIKKQINSVRCKDKHENVANVNVYWIYQNLDNASVYEFLWQWWCNQNLNCKLNISLKSNSSFKWTYLHISAEWSHEKWANLMTQDLQIIKRFQSYQSMIFFKKKVIKVVRGHWPAGKITMPGI